MKKKYQFLHKKFNDDNLVIDEKFKNSLRTRLFPKEEINMAKAPSIKQLSLQNLFKQKALALPAAALLILLAGSSAYAMNARNDTIASRQIIEDTIELPEQLDGLLGVDAMRELASADVDSGISITGIEIENEHGTLLYKVKFSDGTFRLYDAKSGLAYVESESEIETDESVPSDFSAGISLQQARNIAASQRPGKTITKIELEAEHGVVVYSVRFADGGRVDISASSGSVLRVRSSSGGGQTSSDDDSSNHDSDDDEDDDSSGHGSDDDDDNSGHGSGDDDDDDDDNSGRG